MYLCYVQKIQRTGLGDVAIAPGHFLKSCNMTMGKINVRPPVVRGHCIFTVLGSCETLMRSCCVLKPLNAA